MRPLFLACVLLAIAGCQKGPASKVVRRDGQSTLIFVTKSDKEVEAAMAKAREKLPLFLHQLQHPKPGQQFAIKARFKTEGGAEHIWVTHLVYTDPVFVGKLADEPYDLPGLRQGDEVTFTRDQVSDWIINTDGQVYGDFTKSVMDKREQSAGR